MADSWIKPFSGLLLTGQPMWLMATVSGAVGAALWWRRRHPEIVAGGVIVAYLVAFTPVALAVAMYTVGAYCRRLPVLVGFAVAGFVAGVVGLQGGLPNAGVREAGYATALILGPLAVGYAVAAKRDLAEAMQARVVDLEREQRLLEGRARAEERAGIAREMHDVLGHRVSNMVLAAGALQVGTAADLPEMRRTADLIRSDGHQALEELREILGVLSASPGSQAAPVEPVSDADKIAELVAHAVERGQPVNLRIDGFPQMLPAQVQRALHRIVQESLTNAAKHAPGADVDVHIGCRADGVHVDVVNAPPGRAPVNGLPSGGHGLAGLSERVELLGGTLAAGKYNGGFRVSAVIPHR
ncbi:sensor histidine kinase [Streptomyces sp. NPDC001635]